MSDRSPSDLWAALMDGEDEEAFESEITADDVNHRSVMRMARAEERPRLRLRLHGPGVDGHEIASRVAGSVIAELQDVVTSVGAALLDRATSAGSISSDIMRATELRMTPTIGAGSVVLVLIPRTLDDDGLMPRAHGGDGGEQGNLVERSLATTLDLISLAARDDLDDADALGIVKRLGPRARSHILKLSGSLMDAHVDLDADWWTPEGRTRRATMTQRAASNLRRVSKKKYERTEIETYTGRLVTVSSTDDQALMLSDGTKMKLGADAELQVALSRLWGQDVRVRVNTRIVINTSSGAEKRTHTVESVNKV